MKNEGPAATPFKIGIQTWGSDGDINPFIALAGGLAAAGHEVTLAITSAERKNYGHLAESLGFRLIQVGHIFQTDGDLFRISKKIHGTADPLKQLDLLLEEMLGPGIDDMYTASRALCAENDFLIGHFLVHPLQLAAEKSGKPYMTVTLNHGAIPSRYLPPGWLPDLGPRFNLLFWKAAIMVLNRRILPFINRLRVKEGGSPALSFRDVWESPRGNLITVSPAICPADSRWGEHQHICGFFSMPEKAHTWEMPDGLERFLADGPPPVYLTFGSMASIERDAERITEAARLLVNAVKAARCRAIIQANWKDVRGIPEDPAIYRITSAPHTRVFPRCAAVVHHGGSGTAQTAALCGRPSVIVAHILDQYFWGRELKRLGVAPSPLERRTVTPEKLGREIRRVLDSPEMADRAKILGEKLRTEDGVAQAVKIIERALAKTKPRI